jgi:AcrR family transcriptional regulator
MFGRLFAHVMNLSLKNIPREENMTESETFLTEKGRQRRMQILSKASVEFSLRGYHATSVADILSGLNIARGTFYQYFANKKDIFEEILNNLLERISHDLKQMDSEDFPPDTWGRIEKQLQRVLEIMLEDRFTSKLVLSCGDGMEEELFLKIRNFYSYFTQWFMIAFENLMSGSKLPQADMELICAFCVGGLKETLSWLVDRGAENVHLPQVAGVMTDFIANGVYTARNVHDA